MFDFNEGRAVVELRDGTVVSILNPDRQAVLDAAKQWSSSYILHGWSLPTIQCDEDTYEVAFRCRSTHRPEETYPDNDRPIPDGWEQYVMDDDGDRIYAYVPRDLVHEYVTARMYRENEEE